MFSGLIKHGSPSPFWQGAKAGIKESFGWQYKGFLKVGENEGFLGRLATGGLKANALMPAVSIGFTAYETYQGFKQGGFFGGMKAGVKSVAWNAITRGAMNTAAAVMGSAGLLMTAGVAGGLYGGYRLGEAGIARMRKFRNLEVGSDIVDTFGTMATIRQRSLSAIQNTHINGRLAMGGEAALMHVPMMR